MLYLTQKQGNAYKRKVGDVMVTTHEEIEKRRLEELDKVNQDRMAGRITYGEYRDMMNSINLVAQHKHVELDVNHK